MAFPHPRRGFVPPNDGLQVCSSHLQALSQSRPPQFQAWLHYCSRFQALVLGLVEVSSLSLPLQSSQSAPGTYSITVPIFPSCKLQSPQPQIPSFFSLTYTHDHSLQYQAALAHFFTPSSVFDSHSLSYNRQNDALV